MRRTYEVAGRTDKRAMREFLKREGQLLLPMVELVERAELADRRSDRSDGPGNDRGGAGDERRRRGRPEAGGQGARGGRDSVVRTPERPGVPVGSKVRVDRPRLRQRRGGDGAEVEVPAYRAMRQPGALRTACWRS